MAAVRLEQRKRRTCQSFEITAEDLIVSVESPRKTEKWKVPLSTIDPSPVRLRRRAVVPRPLAIVLLAVILLLFAGAAANDPHLGNWGPLSFIVAALIGRFAVRKMAASPYFTSIDSLTFNSRTGSRLGLWFENPNKEEFDAFVAALKTAVEKAQLRAPTGSSSLAVEIQKIKLLLEEGTITPEQFEAAKNKIVGLDRPGRIGF